MSSKLKTNLPSYSIYKHDAIDIPDPGSMQDACHVNFVIDLAQSLCGSVVEHCSVEPKAPRLNSLQVPRIFLCSTLVTRQKASFSISLPSSKLTISLFFMFPTLCEKCVGSLL